MILIQHPIQTNASEASNGTDSIQLLRYHCYELLTFAPIGLTRWRFGNGLPQN